MAEVPYNPVPSVSPDARPPDDYQHLNPTAETFGAAVGRGLEKAGQGLTDASNNTFAISQFYGKVAVDDQVNNVMKESVNIRHGDPTKMVPGPDGKMQPEGGYMSTVGRTALDQRAATEKALDDSIAAARKNLKSPAEQLEFDNQTRRMRSSWGEQIAAHADTQFKTWAQTVNTAAAKLALDHISATAENPEEVKHGTADLTQAYIKNAELHGAKPGDEVWNQALQSAQRDALRARAEAISVNNPARAAEMVEKNKALLGGLYDDLANKFRTRADAQTGEEAATKALQGPKVGAFQQPVEDAIAKAAQETGVDANMLRRFAMIESTGDPMQIKGSYRGLFQMSQTEFQKYGGGNIFDPVDNARAAANKIKAESAEFQQQNGRPATPADLYLVHQQGAAGYAAHMANPDAPAWQNMLSTGEGQRRGEAWAKAAIWGNVPDQVKAKFDNNVNNVTSRDFVGYWSARINNGQAAVMEASKAARQAAAYKIVMDDPALQGNQRATQHALQVINQRITAQTIAEEQVTKLKKEANEVAANGYVTRILKGDFTGLSDQIANDPNLDATTKLKLGEVALKKNGSDIEEANAAYGPGFWKAYKSVTAGPDDPSRIGDMTELLGRAGPGGDLTLAGVQKLGQVIQESHKNVDAHSVNTSKIGLMNYAKSKLSFEQDTGPIKIRDPKGEAIFNAQFIPKFEAAFDAWQKANKNPWEFLTRENIDKMVFGLRNPNQMRMERMAATGESAPDNKGAPLPPAPAGVDAGGWKTLMQSAPVTASGKQWPVDTWAEAVDMLRADPSPEARKEFDELIGKKTGITADMVMNKLNPPKPENKAAAPAGPSSPYLQDAEKQMKFNPQERALYQRHLTNLNGAGGVDNPDGSRSTLYQMTAEVDGKHYLLPTVWDGKILSPDDAFKRAKSEGLDKFPSYATEQAAESRYKQMHDFMERDTAEYMARKKAGPAGRLRSFIPQGVLDYVGSKGR